MKISKHSCLSELATTASLFVVLALASALSGQTKESPDDLIPLIQLESVPLDAAIQNLARQAEFNYILSTEIPNRTISRRWENMSAMGALTNLLAEHKLFLLENPATTVAHISSTNRIKFTVDAKWIDADTNAVLPLIQFQEVTLGKVLTQTARVAGVRINIDPKLTRSSFLSRKRPVADQLVTVHWTKLKLRQAIAALCENYSLTLVEADATGSIYITQK